MRLASMISHPTEMFLLSLFRLQIFITRQCKWSWVEFHIPKNYKKKKNIIDSGSTCSEGTVAMPQFWCVQLFKQMTDGWFHWLGQEYIKKNHFMRLTNKIVLRRTNRSSTINNCHCHYIYLLCVCVCVCVRSIVDHLLITSSENHL